MPWKLVKDAGLEVAGIAGHDWLSSSRLMNLTESATRSETHDESGCGHEDEVFVASI